MITMHGVGWVRDLSRWSPRKLRVWSLCCTHKTNIIILHVNCNWKVKKKNVKKEKAFDKNSHQFRIITFSSSREFPFCEIYYEHTQCETIQAYPIESWRWQRHMVWKTLFITGWKYTPSTKLLYKNTNTKIDKK